MKHTKSLIGRSGALLAAFGLLTAVVVPVVLPAGQAQAAQITSRKIQLGSSELGSVSTDANGTPVTAGNGGNGAQTSHAFSFTVPSASNIGGILFQYCDSPFVGTTCNAPSGMDASTVTAIASSSGYLNTAFTLNTTVSGSTGWFATNGACAGAANARTNCFLVSRATAAPDNSAQNFTFGSGANGWLKNPTATTPNNGTFYVRVVTFTDNTFATAVDSGTVAFNVNNDIDITAKVQEQLKFSVSSSTNVAGATCASLPAGTSLTLGSAGVLDSGNAYDTHSYIRVSTNSANGTAVQYSAPTLHTVAGDTITVPAGMATVAATPTPGTEQFGLGFDSGDPIGVNGWSVTHLTTRPAPYNSANGASLAVASFGYDPASVSAPKTLATSANIVGCDTLSVRYVANISPTTKPGIYKTNVDYFGTPTY